MDEKIIGNVNILDLRKATEASVSEISKVLNANVVLFNQGAYDLVAQLVIDNVNIMVDVPPNSDVQRIIGQLILSRDHFESVTQPVFFLVTGQMIIDQGVSAEDIEKGVAGSVITGQLYCPEPIAGVFQSKNNQIIGQTIAYPPLRNVKIGSITLTENLLEAWDNDTELAVIGNLNVPDVLPNELLKNKLKILFVSGRSRCHEENVQAIRKCLTLGSGKLTIIPTGHKLVDKHLHADVTLLETPGVNKLYCTHGVEINSDVNPDLLETKLESIISEGTIFCPEKLKHVFITKCDLLENDVVFFKGNLWMIAEKQTLRKSRLENLDGEATLYVTGELTVDPDITAELLSTKLNKIHNLGTVHCTPEQMGVIESKLGIKSGELKDSTVVEETVGKHWIDNANYLAL